MSSPNPYASVPSGGGQAAPNGPVAQIPDNIQPIVRVMRLYKPGLHMASAMPYFHGRNDLLPPALHSEAAPYMLSNFLLLPDSFGDIYLGEKFTAYISIINGSQSVTLQNVVLNVRLQTTTSVVDLPDIRPSNNASSTVLSFHDTKEVVVSYPLSELGTHTLRVSVQYSSPFHPEVKTLRKFYRFNVLQPLMVLSSYLEVAQLPMVQGQITNSTKSPIFIDEIKFVGDNSEAVFAPLYTSTKLLNPYEAIDHNDILLLQPGESYAFAFQCLSNNLELCNKVVGYPVVRWSNSFGEASFYRGEDTMIKPGLTPSALLAQPIKGILLSSPAVVEIGERFEVSVRLVNTSSSSFPATLSCRNGHDGHAVGEGKRPPAAAIGLVFVGLTSYSIGAVEDYVDVKIDLYAAAEGLHDLPPIGIIHTISKERFYLTGLCKILVKEEMEREGVEERIEQMAVSEEEVVVSV